VAPKQVAPLNKAICKVITNSLATRFCALPKVVRKFILEDVEQWGKLHCLEGGDIIHVHDIVPKHMDGRDTSFIHVCDLILLGNNLILSLAQ